MGRHICALQHLGKATESTDNVLNQLECCCCALAEGLCKTVVWVAGHAAHASIHPSVHASHTTIHASHAAHTTVHGSIRAAHGRVRRGIAAHTPITAAIRRAVSVVHARVRGRVPVRDGAKGVWYGWQGRSGRRDCWCGCGCARRCAAVRCRESCVVVSRICPYVPGRLVRLTNRGTCRACACFPWLWRRRRRHDGLRVLSVSLSTLRASSNELQGDGVDGVRAMRTCQR